MKNTAGLLSCWIVALVSALAGQQRPSAPPAFTGSGADARYALPLHTLPSGAYVLRLEASAGQSAQHREVRFTMK